jgi:hypothetical protein
MTVRRLDADSGDIVTRGNQFLTGREEVEQTIRTRLWLYLGEYFRDVTDGTPWHEQILGKFANLSTVEAVLRARIANSPGVVRIASFSTDFDLNTRKFSFRSTVITEQGLVELGFDG